MQVAMHTETTKHELMETVFPHPTLPEMMHEAVLDAYGRGTRGELGPRH
jgi:dihydrolipoamide dehydrogenase